MSKITKWVNTSLHLEPDEYQDWELAKLFKVTVKQVCAVTGRVNDWMVRQGIKNGQDILMFWHTYGRLGVWFKLVGDDAARAKIHAEIAKTLRRLTAQLRRILAMTKLTELTSGMKVHIDQVFVRAELSCKLALDVYDSLPESEKNKLLKEYLKPYRKLVYDPDDED